MPLERCVREEKTRNGRGIEDIYLCSSDIRELRLQIFRFSIKSKIYHKNKACNCLILYRIYIFFIANV